MLRILIPLFLALVLSSPAAGARGVIDDPDECLRLAERDDVLANSLPRDGRKIASIRLTGASIADDALWDLAGGPPAPPLSIDEAAALVSRLAQTGLFASVDPHVKALPDDEVAELTVSLTENAKITAVAASTARLVVCAPRGRYVLSARSHKP